MLACFLGARLPTIVTDWNYGFKNPRYILGEEKAKVIQERLVPWATQVQLQRRRFDG